MLKDVKYLFTIVAVVTSFMGSVFAQGSITVPPNWPEQKMMLGLAWASTEDGKAIQDHGGSLTNYYTYRYINASNGSSAVSEMSDASSVYPGLPKQSVITQLFIDDEVNVAPAGTRKDLLITKLQTPTFAANFFTQLFQAAVHINTAGAPIVVLEPDALGYILQARFHLEEEVAPVGITSPVFTGAIPVFGEDAKYKNILNFPAAVKPSSNGLGPEFAFLEDYPNTIAGFMRAMVRASKVLMPTATVTGHAAAWAVYADGCSGSGSAEALGQEVVNGNVDVLGTQSVVTWDPADVELAALSNVKFMRELYGWDPVNNTPALAGLDWPHAIAVEKGNSLASRDAGLIQFGPTQFDGSAQLYPADRPAAGTTALYWDQVKNDKWLNWAKNISHGIKLPLIALRIPVGNGSLVQNTAFHYQDTFLDWLYSSANWTIPIPGTPMAPIWNPNNLTNFKNAGFVGLFIGRDGWPAAGTHYGSRINTEATGYNGTPPDSIITGDNGFAITTFQQKDMSLAPVPVDFDETNFATFTGFCDLTETTVKVATRGTVIATTSTGTQVLGAGNIAKNNDDFLSENEFPEELKNNTIIFYNDGMPFTPNFNRLEVVDPVTDLPISGKLSTSNVNLTQPLSGEVTAALEGLSEMWIDIEMEVPGMEFALDNNVDLGDRIKSIYPMSYRFDLYDHTGQFVASDSGTISEQDLIRLSSNVDNKMVTNLNMRILPTNEDGRQLGTGVYIFRGFIKEEAKFMCETGIDLISGSPNSLTLRQLVNQTDCVAAGGTWLLRTRNAVVVKDKIPYVRIH